MWVVSEFGFYNIVCQDGDFNNGLLTFKARDKRDLVNLLELCNIKRGPQPEIEESDGADYRFRTKIPLATAANVMREMVQWIHYPKTKPKITEKFPERGTLYLDVWSDLYRIQEIYEAKA